MSSYRYVFLHIGLYRGPFSAQLFGFSFAELTQTLIFISQAFCFQGKEKPFSKVSRTRVWTKRRGRPCSAFWSTGGQVFKNINATFVRVKRVRWNKLLK